MNRCVICDIEVKYTEVRSINQTHTVDVINGAVICETTGNYGSTILDLAVWPKNDRRDRWLEFFICDKCMVLKKDYFTLINLVPHRDTYERIPWDPNND